MRGSFTARQRALAIGVLVLSFGVTSVGVAVAGISGGNYDLSRQHCSGYADDSDNPSNVEQGCRSAAVSIEDGKGTEAVGVGTQQTADGENANSLTDPVVDPNVDPTSGGSAYFGADDNLDSGEHDSSPALHNGPSDGGAVLVGADPTSLARFIAALRAADVSYLLTHPLPIFVAGAGSCADGICESVQTQRQVVYQGDNTKKAQDVSDYDGRQWDPASCAGPSDTHDDCGHNGIEYWNHRAGTYYAEPGVQVYEDPDPEGSPELVSYPLDGVAVTTCGVYAGGGYVHAPGSPVTNGADQVAVKTAC